ncbi:MAG: DUF4249 domain-containing protein [Tangfeifania sp.]
MKKLILLILLVFIFFSCRKEIEIDLDELPQKPVINCLFTTGKPFQVHVSLSKSPTDTASYHINDALVKLYGNDGTDEQLPSSGNGYYSKSSVTPTAGVQYTLKVNIPGMEETSATGSIPPNTTKITEIESKSGFKTEPVMGTGDEARMPVQNLKVKILHDPQESDFMGLSVVQYALTHHRVNDSIFIVEDKNKYYYGYLNSDDPAILSEGLGNFYIYQMLLFRDINFTDQPATVRFNVEKEKPSKFWLRFFHFSPEAFQYVKSWFIHDYTQDYDFWEIYEPQPLYSNIENGYGIFAGYSMQLYEVYPDSTLTFE